MTFFQQEIFRGTSSETKSIENNKKGKKHLATNTENKNSHEEHPPESHGPETRGQERTKRALFNFDN